MIRGFRVRCPTVRRPGNTKPIRGGSKTLTRIPVGVGPSIVRVYKISIRSRGLAAFSHDGDALLDSPQAGLLAEDLQGFKDPG